jgi:ketopantoate hydroxymethyltransferase
VPSSIDTISKLAASNTVVVIGLSRPRLPTGVASKTAAGASRCSSTSSSWAAGAIGAELEVVPDRVAAEISKRTSLVMLSMGAGAGGDAQYLFAEDVLGYTRGHKPRHAKIYRNFRSEFERLQRERIAAFTEYKADVDSGAYPGKEHVVRIDDAEYEKFMTALKR